MAVSRGKGHFLDGVPELIVLRLLQGRAMYGYELVQAIKSASDDVLEFGEGCIYPLLHRLCHEKFLVSDRQEVNGRSRVLYRVTPSGKRHLAENQARWKAVNEAVASILANGG